MRRCVLIVFLALLAAGCDTGGSKSTGRGGSVELPAVNRKGR